MPLGPLSSALLDRPHGQESVSKPIFLFSCPEEVEHSLINQEQRQFQTSECSFRDSKGLANGLLNPSEDLQCPSNIE